MKIIIPKYSPMFIAALFTITRAWKQHKSPSTEKLIRKMHYICRAIHIALVTLSSTGDITQMRIYCLSPREWSFELLIAHRRIGLSVEWISRCSSKVPSKDQVLSVKPHKSCKCKISGQLTWFRPYPRGKQWACHRPDSILSGLSASLKPHPQWPHC